MTLKNSPLLSTKRSDLNSFIAINVIKQTTMNLSDDL